MSIQRSGTPFQAHSTAVSSVSVTLPSGTKVGDLCIVYAFSSLTGAFGATPAGWNVVPNSTQTATSPSCIAYSRVLQAGDTAPTITLQGSANCGFGSFAYSGTNLTDTDGVQNNASSTTCTAPSVSPVGSADMLVMIGGGGSKTFSAPTNGLALWLGAASSGSGIADKQLSASGATGSSAMTMSGTAVASSGIQLTLQPLDSDGEAITSTSRGRGRMLPFARATIFNGGMDDFIPVAGSSSDDACSPVKPRAFVAFRQPRFSGYDENTYAAANPDESNSPPIPRLKRFWVPSASGADEQAFYVAPNPDEANTSIVPRLARFRQSRSGDNQSVYIAPNPDEANIPLVPRLPGFKQSRAGDDQSVYIAANPDEATRAVIAIFKRFRPGQPVTSDHSAYIAPNPDEANSPTWPRLTRFRQSQSGKDEQVYVAANPDEAQSAVYPRQRPFKQSQSGRDEQAQYVAPNPDEANSPPVPRLRRFRPGPAPEDEGSVPVVASATDESSVITPQRWTWLRRSRSGDDQSVYIAPNPDEANTSIVPRLGRFKQSKSGDDQQAQYIAPNPDGSATPIIPRLRRFKPPLQVGDDTAIAPVATDESAVISPRRGRSGDDQSAYVATNPDEANISVVPKLRGFRQSKSGDDQAQYIAPNPDEAATPQSRRMGRFTWPVVSSPGENQPIVVASDDAQVSMPRRIIRWFWRRMYGGEIPTSPAPTTLGAPLQVFLVTVPTAQVSLRMVAPVDPLSLSPAMVPSAQISLRMLPAVDPLIIVLAMTKTVIIPGEE